MRGGTSPKAASAPAVSRTGCPVATDQHSRLLVESGLKERGVRRVIHRAWSPSSQTEAFRRLRARIYGDTIVLPISDQLQRELCRVRERTRAGSSAVELPSSVDGHCDLASALALAVWEHDRLGVPRQARTWSSFRVRQRPVAEHEWTFAREPQARRPRVT